MNQLDQYIIETIEQEDGDYGTIIDAMVECVLNEDYNTLRYIENAYNVWEMNGSADSWISVLENVIELCASSEKIFTNAEEKNTHNYLYPKKKFREETAHLYCCKDASDYFKHVHGSEENHDQYTGPYFRINDCILVTRSMEMVKRVQDIVDNIQFSLDNAVEYGDVKGVREALKTEMGFLNYNIPENIRHNAKTSKKYREIVELVEYYGKNLKENPQRYIDKYNSRLVTGNLPKMSGKSGWDLESGISKYL